MPDAEGALSFEAFRAKVEPPAGAVPLPWSDDALAERFAATHGHELRYVATWKRWLRWDGSRWRRDNTLCVFDQARTLCRAVAAELDKADLNARRALGDANTVSAIERLARSDRRLAARPEQWDADIWLLNTPGGVVDLRTGAVRPATPDDLMTQATAVAPAPAGTDCPLWRAFLARVTGGDDALQAYLRRLIGYCLTGSTQEQMLAFLHGTGANGKGVFLNTIAAILGDYAKTAPAETFEASPHGRHPTELAMLQGARLITAQETEEGRRWAEARIKSLTGGDPITARFMHGDFFTYQPQFTLLIAGNHKPGLKSVDEAIRRRLHLVPFTVTIPAQERDGTLTERLRQEAPAILRWAIEGCLAWRHEGLRPPPAVIAATDEYLQSCDLFGDWLGECTETASDYTRETSADLYTSWRTFAERAGEKPGSKKDLGERLSRAGFRARKGTAGWREFAGLSLKRHDYSENSRHGGG